MRAHRVAIRSDREVEVRACDVSCAGCTGASVDWAAYTLSSSAGISVTASSDGENKAWLGPAEAEALPAAMAASPNSAASSATPDLATLTITVQPLGGGRSQ